MLLSTLKKRKFGIANQPLRFLVVTLKWKCRCTPKKSKHLAACVWVDGHRRTFRTLTVVGFSCTNFILDVAAAKSLSMIVSLKKKQKIAVTRSSQCFKNFVRRSYSYCFIVIVLASYKLKNPLMASGIAPWTLALSRESAIREVNSGWWALNLDH